MNLSCIEAFVLRIAVLISVVAMLESFPLYFLSQSRKHAIRQLMNSKRRQRPNNRIDSFKLSVVSTTSEDEPDSSSRICVVDTEVNDTAMRNGREDLVEMLKSVTRDLSSKLSIPLISQTFDDRDFSFGLYVVPYKSGNIESYAVGIDSVRSQPISKRRQAGKSNPTDPFVIDFCPSADSQTVKRSMGQTGKDLLVQAVAPKRMRPNGATILDLTAGFGQDSMILAHSGASQVHMVEKNPIVSALLCDAMRRLGLLTTSDDYLTQERASYLSQRLVFTEGDGYQEATKISQLLESTTERRPDVCYLDPMFPPRTKAAKVKKGMQLLHGLLDSQNITMDPLLLKQAEGEFLTAAYNAALHRLVVKRPKNAPVFGEGILVPSHQIIGSVNRWDVYMKK